MIYSKWREWIIPIALLIFRLVAWLIDKFAKKRWWCCLCIYLSSNLNGQFEVSYLGFFHQYSHIHQCYHSHQCSHSRGGVNARRLSCLFTYWFAQLTYSETIDKNVSFKDVTFKVYVNQSVRIMSSVFFYDVCISYGTKFSK